MSNKKPKKKMRIRALNLAIGLIHDKLQLAWAPPTPEGMRPEVWDEYVQVRKDLVWMRDRLKKK